jgi:hypothetical protein
MAHKRNLRLDTKEEHGTERFLATRIANLRLENTSEDPDSDFSIVCRQFLRANEHLEMIDYENNISPKSDLRQMSKEELIRMIERLIKMAEAGAAFHRTVEYLQSPEYAAEQEKWKVLKACREHENGPHVIVPELGRCRCGLVYGK